LSWSSVVVVPAMVVMPSNEKICFIRINFLATKNQNFFLVIKDTRTRGSSKYNPSDSPAQSTVGTTGSKRIRSRELGSVSSSMPLTLTFGKSFVHKII
jgi:hypothetical protein